MKITESRASEILNWLDDETGNHTHLFEDMARYRDAAALVRQLQAAEQDAWRAGLDAGREQKIYPINVLISEIAIAWHVPGAKGNHFDCDIAMSIAEGIHALLTHGPSDDADREQVRTPSSPDYKNLFAAAVDALAEISVALGIPDDVAQVANGNAEMLARIRDLQTAEDAVRNVRSLLPTRVETQSLGDYTPEECAAFDSGYNSALDRVHNLINRRPGAIASINAAQQEGHEQATPRGTDDRECVAWRHTTPYGVGYSFLTEEVMSDMAAGLAQVRIAAKPLDEWNEDIGVVTWWKFPVDEPAWIGTPLDDDWPGYHTHWTPQPATPASPCTQTED